MCKGFAAGHAAGWFNCPAGKRAYLNTRKELTLNTHIFQSRSDDR